MSGPDSPSTQDPNSNPSPVQSPPSPPPSLLPPPSSSTRNDTVAESSDATATGLTTGSAAVTKPRRLPPPCWSHEETVALIDAYSDKWHALHRGNLKANHWQEVAEAVAARCPGVTPQKTSVQCRHKMEKLRKRYRTEIQRARSVPVSRFTSSWVHYKRMEAMEKGPESRPENRADSEEDEDEYPSRHRNSSDGYKNGGVVVKTKPMFLNRNGNAGSGSGVVGSSRSGGIRIRIPTGVSIAQPGPRIPGKIDQKYTTNVKRGRTGNVSGNRKPSVGAGFDYGSGVGRVAKRERDDPLMEIAGAMKLLGETLMRTELSKMEMAREVEAMKMEMEIKRTEMILETQRRIVESFAKSLRRIASDDS